MEETCASPCADSSPIGTASLSDSDLKHLLSFLESPAGKRYVTAYNASMGAGFDAMGKRTGEQLGESLRELGASSARRARPSTTGAAAPGIAALPESRHPAPRRHAQPDARELGEKAACSSAQIASMRSSRR